MTAATATVSATVAASKGLAQILAKIASGEAVSEKTHHKCGACGRKLTDPESQASGVGPICAGHMRDALTALGYSEKESAGLHYGGRVQSSAGNLVWFQV